MKGIPSWLLSLFGFLATLLLILVIISQAYALSAHVQGTNTTQHTITITATGKVTAAPDLAELSASVQTQASSAQSAQLQNTTQMNAVIAVIKKDGIASADIQTSDYSINPAYNFNSGLQKITGYTANQTITVNIHDLSLVGKVLTDVTAQGANEVGDVNYTFNNIDDFREQAREQALASAHDKAEKLASAAGAKLGKLVSFSDEDTPTSIVYPMAAGAVSGNTMAEPAAQPTPQTQPGTQDITENVSVIYGIN